MTKVTLRKLTKRRFALITDAGVIHYKDVHGVYSTTKNLREFKENYPNVDVVRMGGGYDRCVDIEKCSENGEEYLSFIPFCYTGSLYRVSNYKELEPEQIKRVGLHSRVGWRNFNEDISFECRLYKNRKMLLLLSIDIRNENGDIIDTKIYTVRRPKGSITDIIWFLRNQRGESINTEPSPNLYLIQNYEDIEPSSYFTDTAKQHNIYKMCSTGGYQHYQYVNDQYSEIKEYMTYSREKQFFSNEIGDLFTEFFNLNDKDYGINKKYPMTRIESIGDLFEYVTIKEPTTKKAKKSTYNFTDEELVNEIYKDIKSHAVEYNIILRNHTDYYSYDNDEYRYDVVLNRIEVFGEQIIYISQNPTCTYRRWAGNCSYLLVIFLQRKVKRLLKIRTDISNDNIWNVIDISRCIPSFRTIFTNINPSSKYIPGEGYGKSHYEHKEVIHFKPLEEIYKGTILENLINNINPEANLNGMLVGRHGSSWGCESTKMKDNISYNKFTRTSLLVMLGIKNPIIEQLSNNKLNNILFLLLSDNNRDGSYKIFTDTIYNNYGYSDIKISSKATSLKKYFNMSMPQLKMLDTKVGEIIKTATNNFTKEINDYDFHFHLYKISRTLGIENYNSMRDESFAKLLDMATKENMSRYSLSAEETAIISETIKNYKLEQKISILEEIGDGMNEFIDYYRIRKQMVKLQESLPEEKIFTKQDEKRYSIRPSGGEIFIHYFSEVENNQGYSWMFYDCRTTEEHFIKRIQQTYSPIEIKKIYNDSNELIGAKVTLTRRYMVKLLHDELSKIHSLYIDQSKNVLFKEALKRVEKLCWKDEEMGLEIVTPRDINDLKNEGSVLSHCVASYVEPICEGSENILFIRRTDMPWHPYFTMDLVYPNNDYTKPGQIRQIHCYRNGDPTEDGISTAYRNSGFEVYDKYYDIIKFVQKWATKMNGKLNKNTINAHYGALCANRH